MAKIAVVLPALNEEISIGSMVLRAKQYADIVLVVDDGSVDRTAEVAALAGAQVICHLKNMGKGAALKTGFEAADSVDVIVTIDADGQHDPAEIPKLVEPILKGEADIVNGSRYIDGNRKDTPTYRRFGQNILDKATNIASGLYITDTQSGFRAFAARVVPVFQFNQTGMAIESEMLVDAAKAGLRVQEVEIGVRYDVDCSTENPMSHGMKVLLNVLYDMELNRPLYYFTAPGILITSIGFVMGLKFLHTHYYEGIDIPFGPTLLMVLLTLIGIFMAFTGITLHSMSRLINQAKKNTE